MSFTSFLTRRVASNHGLRANMVVLVPRRGLADVKPPKQPREMVSITFVAANGEKQTVKAPLGDSILEIAHDNDIEIEGACGGEMACSTCHVILTPEVFHKLPKPCDEEEDMLDLAIGLTPTSRLGCQVRVTKDLDGMVVQLPAEVSNMQKKDY